jgi:hypothetical protein
MELDLPHGWRVTFLVVAGFGVVLALPITGIPEDWARAASGHPAAPPISPSASRRLTRLPRQT